MTFDTSLREIYGKSEALPEVLEGTATVRFGGLNKRWRGS